MQGPQDLRTLLRTRTRPLHDAVDTAMGPLAEGPDYATFLLIQHAARLPLEQWLADNAPPGWEPPAQTPLIAADLAALGHACPASDGRAPTALPPQAFLGLAWALAGSSMGNRAMLVRRRKRGLAGADSFLSDGAMVSYWHRLLPLLERPAEYQTSPDILKGAEAAFASFLEHAQKAREKLAA